MAEEKTSTPSGLAQTVPSTRTLEERITYLEELLKMLGQVTLQLITKNKEESVAIAQAQYREGKI